MKLTAQQLQDMGYVETAHGWIKEKALFHENPQPFGHYQHPKISLGPANPPPKRIRQSQKPLLNKLEEEWLDCLKLQFMDISSQSLRFKLGNGIWYKPDFVAWPRGLESIDHRMRAYEVKGPFAHRGGFENLKVAAHQYPQIKWTLCWKQDGKWKEQTVLP